MSILREKALSKIKETFEADGFRKGNVPETIIVQKVGEMRILEEAAEIALTEEYPNILEEHKIEAIGRPEISINKLGLGSPMEFKAKTSLMPEVKLADYKKIANQQGLPTLGVGKLIEVKENEVEDVILNIRQNIAHQSESQLGHPMSKLEGNSEQTEPVLMEVNVTDEEVEGVILNIRQNIAHQSKSQLGHPMSRLEDNPDQAKPALMEVNDEFAKMIGNFKDVGEMKMKIKENVALEKSMKEKDKRRV